MHGLVDEYPAVINLAVREDAMGTQPALIESTELAEIVEEAERLLQQGAEKRRQEEQRRREDATAREQQRARFAYD